MELTDELAAISIDTEPRKVLNEAPKKGKGKVRKGQSAEEYQRQVDLYTSGPPVQTLTSIMERDYSNIDGMDRLDRHAVRHAAERAYFLKKYAECIKVVDDSKLLESPEVEKKHARDVYEIRVVYDSAKSLV
ncbi:hypothetical protein B0I75DRAFT_139793 [Yarrowia lipolytica]|uniref:Uncharacterized protein n=1 Tax=Yarrowia lipolytica TaxID=4952 RepID=A0A371C3Z8_YARLL|nr:hypothetical protein B0I71DRAFT_133266 [Yarrowia lipolytica]RDW45605.1 hypothetical protein B0I74DRAFT_138404 [Yarrowia lipolytica]RDW51520.1 hypothetical protein B0I75DRAFT_139793 [Yarrowia lipolytica]